MTLRLKFFSTNILAMFIVLRFSHAHLVKKHVCLEQGNSAYQRMRYRPRTKTTVLVTMVAVAQVLHYVNQGAISRLGGWA